MRFYNGVAEVRKFQDFMRRKTPGCQHSQNHSAYFFLLSSSAMDWKDGGMGVLCRRQARGRVEGVARARQDRD